MHIAPVGPPKTPEPHDESSTPVRPETELQRQADEVLRRFRAGRSNRPLIRVRAWLGMPTVQVVTAEEVWFAWRRFKIAKDAALAGGETEGLLELHDDFTRILQTWLNGPAA